MIYQAYEAARRSTRPLYHILNTGQKLARDTRNPLRNTLAMRTLATMWELPARAMKDYGKPRYQVWEELDGAEIGLQETVVQSLPFADLLHFPVDDGREKPKVLIAAALLLGLVNAVIRPIAIVLTFPLTLVTLGLFLLVVNAAMMGLVAVLLSGFSIAGFWTAIGASIVVSITSWVASGLIGNTGRFEVMMIRK